MLNKVFGVLTISGFVGAVIFGRAEEVAAAALSGAASAVSVTVSLIGAMCLWCGIMRVCEELGALRVLARLLSPLLRLIFPDAWRRRHGIEEISAALAANIFGIGNAATPLAISAMKALEDNKRASGDHSSRASDDMVTFTVLGSSSLDLVPTTLIALRAAAGSSDPFEIIVPVWLVSLSCSILAVLLARLGRRRM